MRPAILVLLLAAAASAQPASIDGIVVNHATGQPLSGVHVRLMAGDFDNSGVDRVYGAISDKAGHYSVTGMKPGFYLVLLERTGYLQVQMAGAMPFGTIALKTGQNLTGQKFEMNPRALIKGRVVDEYGDPVKGIPVELRPVSPDHGTAQPFFGGPNRGTDDRGEFRILTSPGKYYLRALSERYDLGEPPEVRIDGSLPSAYAATYYPSATETAGASIVEVGPGEDIAGIEIHLIRKAISGRGFSLSGKVMGLPEGARANIMLRHGENVDQFDNARGAAAAADGTFTFTGLQPGAYRVSAQASSGKTSLQSAPVDIQLGSADQGDVQLILKPGEEIIGTLEIGGNPASGAPVEKRTVSLEPLDSNGFGASEATAGDTDKLGAFRLTNIFPGRFHVTVDPLPDNAFIKSVTLDGAQVPDDILDFSHGVAGSRLKITVSLNGAQISGKVLGRDGEPLVSPWAMVMVWRDDKDAQADTSNRAVNGEYSIKALRPGKYRLAVVDMLDMSNFANDDGDKSTEALKAAAQQIEVKEGDRVVQDLKAIGKEDLHLKPKQ